MTQAYLNGPIPIFGNFPAGFNGWGPDMNRNLLLMSYFAQPSVINTAQRTPPSTLINGTMYIVRSGNTFASSFYFPGDSASTGIPANSIVVYDLGGWWYIPPKLGMQVYNQAASAYYTYNGSAWVPVISPAVWARRYLGASQSAAGADRDINLTSAESSADTLGLYNTSRKRLIIPEAGIYDIRLHAANAFDGTGGSSVGQAIFRIYKGSTIVSESSQFSEPLYNRNLVHNCQYLGRFALNEEVRFTAGTGGGSKVMAITGGLNITYFDCKRVGDG